MNPGNSPAHSDAILINENVLAANVYYKNKHIVSNINFWHKFIIHNTVNIPRDVVLRVILDHVHPLDLIPVCYGTSGNTSYFLARNCGAAIEKLCKDNLIVPKTNDHPAFKLTIILKFATSSEFKIDIQKNIMNVLQKRYDGVNKVLNLTKFHEDADLTEFCPLSQPKIMFYILHLSKSLQPAPEGYILRSNLIKILSPLEGLTGLKKVTHLDLRNNLIMNMEDIAALKSFSITELLLDFNPLCDKCDEQTYVKSVQKYCPKILKLDGMPVKEGNLATIKTNFLCNPAGYDLVSQFIEYFFSAYDSTNRRLMEGLYHKNAMFSLTSAYHAAQLTSVTTQLRLYNNISRNLLKLADVSRNLETLYRGSLQVINLFCRLPPTEHDPYSFKVDLIHHTPRCAVICVSGVFREVPQNLLDPERIFGFTRTFALEILNGDKECSIVNEQLHLYNALTSQVVSSFKGPRPVEVNIIPQASNPKEQQQLADTLKIITNLTTDWARKCLEECNYDLKKALSLFVDLYKVDKIPPEAFLTSNNS